MTRPTVAVELSPLDVPSCASYRLRVNGEEHIDLDQLDPSTLAALCDEWRVSVFKKAGKDDPAKAKASHKLEPFGRVYEFKSVFPPHNSIWTHEPRYNGSGNYLSSNRVFIEHPSQPVDNDAARGK